MIYQAEKMLRDAGDKVGGDVKRKVEGKIAAVRSAVQGKEVDRIQRTTQDLSEAMQRAGQSMYSQQTPPRPLVVVRPEWSAGSG